MGIEVLIDDFGTGHSSLLYLKQLPAKTLKLDRMFIDGIASSSEDRMFLEKVVGLVGARGKSIVAEGVETEAQVSYLRDLSVEKLQGYFFSAPVTMKDLLNLLDS
jgi:EAL domain-containing protein (putative c-di-GMP-specific phosphodiesterase class I)